MPDINTFGGWHMIKGSNPGWVTPATPMSGAHQTPRGVSLLPMPLLWRVARGSEHPDLQFGALLESSWKMSQFCERSILLRGGDPQIAKMM